MAGKAPPRQQDKHAVSLCKARSLRSELATSYVVERIATFCSLSRGERMDPGHALGAILLLFGVFYLLIRGSVDRK